MSEVLDPPVTHPVSAALDALDAALDTLADAELATLGPVCEATARLHRAQCRADAVLHRLVREVDATGAALAAGAPSTAAWLRHRLRLHPGSARRLVATARAVYHDPTGPLTPEHGTPTAAAPVLARAFAAGQVSAEHAAVTTQVLGELPATVDRDTRAHAETYLVDQARCHDPKALAHLGRHLRHVLDPDGPARLAADDEHTRRTRTLDLRQHGDGSADLRGHLDPELTAALLAQLMALAAPRPAHDGRPDPRTTGQRHADALADLVRLAASTGAIPTRHGTRPTISVHLLLDTLQHRPGSPAAHLDWAGPISADTARRLACDANLIPIVLGAHGEPLDVGRATYPVTTAIWRALVARDRGCAFAGCDRPPEWTEAHHRTHWADGGETSVKNCCLLCDHHHRAVHHHGWTLDLINGTIHTIPPPWVDPTQTPRRQTGRARLADLTNHTHPPD